MANQSRSLHVTMTRGCLLIAFIWFTQNKHGKLSLEHKYVEGVDAELLDEIRSRLNSLGAIWHIAALQEDRLSLICDFPDALQSYYDAIVSSHNVVAALTTPFEVVLQPFERSVNVQ